MFYKTFKEERSQRDIYTHMFLTSLLIIAKKWKKVKSPLIGDWIKKILYRGT